MAKFENLPVEFDTKVISREQIKILNYDAMHEIWSWDGIKGESIIFVTEEINELSENGIIDLVKSAFQIEDISQVTISQGKSDYTFVNLNFEV